MNTDLINKINDLSCQLQALKEKLDIAIQGLKAIEEITENSIAEKTLEAIKEVDGSE
tara:strand:+ start:3197 stop:3367 length:171 start_codon:yes stop_codon:yes gene_type:complete